MNENEIIIVDEPNVPLIEGDDGGPGNNPPPPPPGDDIDEQDVPLKPDLEG